MPPHPYWPPPPKHTHTPPARPPCSQYAFRASTQDTQGITWSNLSDDNNGLPGAMIIMAVEWAVFMAAAW